MLEGIIWDFDGVIGDTQKRQYQWFKYWAQENKVHFPYPDFETFIPVYNHEISKGVQQAYDAFNLPCDMNDHTHPVWIAYNKFKLENPVQFFPDIPKVVAEIRFLTGLSENINRNIRTRMVINTTNSWKTIYPELNENNIAQHFDGYVTAEILKDYVGFGPSKEIMKPSKVSVAMSVGILNAEGAPVLHIGDCLSDLAASHDVFRFLSHRRQTMHTVGVSWGFEGRKRLEMGTKNIHGDMIYFDHIVDKPRELIDVVKSYL